MSLLPKQDMKKEIDLTPRLIVVGGAAMTGKTFQACRFPNPILINTDGNCKKINVPDIYLNDRKYKTYKEKLELLFGALKELNETETPYKTIVIDLIEDIFDICENYVLEKYKVDNLSKVPGYATGYTERKARMHDVISALKTLSGKYYVCVITHTVDKVVDDKLTTFSMLKEDFYILLEGQADLVVNCKKIGSSTYVTKIQKSRHDYKKEEVKKLIDKEVSEVIKDYE